MENLSILAAIMALPAICFMLMAKITGQRQHKWLLWIFVKGPSLISIVALIVIALVKFNFLKLA